MASLTIKIDAEFLKHFGQVPKEEPAPTTSEEPAPTPALTNSAVFDFLRAKGETLEAACKNDSAIGDFFASFTTLPEKRIESEIEPLGFASIGSELVPEKDDFNPRAACIEKMTKENEVFTKQLTRTRTNALEIPDDVGRYQYLLSQAGIEGRDIRKAAKLLIFEFIANRDLDPSLIRELCTRNFNLYNSFNEYKESEFLARYKRTTKGV